MLSKFGNLSIREILVVTYSHVTVRPFRPSVRTDSAGEGGESQDNPTGGGGRECYLFLAGNRAVQVLYLTKKTSNIYKWKERVQKNTGRRRKVQVTKAAFKGLNGFVFFTAESLPCSETYPSK